MWYDIIYDLGVMYLTINMLPRTLKPVFRGDDVLTKLKYTMFLYI